MNVRVNTLWRVPVFYLCASWFCFYLTVYLGRFIFVVKETGADGVTEISVDPIRSSIFDLVLLLAVLLLGGLWACRGMTKLEIFLSAAIIAAVYVIIDLLQLSPLEFPVPLSLMLSKFQDINGMVCSLLLRLTNHLAFSVLISGLTPFLLVLFGKKSTCSTTASI